MCIIIKVCCVYQVINMDKDEDTLFWSDNHQAEDLSAKMARKSKPIPPPLNLSAMGDCDASNSPLKDFASFATSPRSPLVQKNLPFRKRAHSYSSTQTSSESDSPESPRVPASPIPAAPSPSPFVKSPLNSPGYLFGKRFLHEPIKSLLPSPNTSASFFNNECDPIKSPSLGYFGALRPAPDLLPIPMLDKSSSLKSPLQTPTRSVFLQNHVESALFFTDMEKLPLKSPLNTPTPRSVAYSTSNDVFVMPEPISVKTEPAEPEKENLVNACDVKNEPSEPREPLPYPPRLGPLISDIKREADSPEQERSQDYMVNHHYFDPKSIENFTSNRNSKNFYISQNYGFYTEITPPPPQPLYAEPAPRGGKPVNYHKPQTYRKNATPKRPVEKQDDEAPKKSKKELDEERPRRPMNAFMLFAKHQRPLLIQQHPGKDNRAISVVLGTAWRELEPGERADYVRRAAAMALEHKRRHPDCWKRRRVRVSNNATPAPPPTANITTTS